MIMIKKIVFFILILILGSCGYQPLYSNKGNFNELIKNFEIKGNKSVNRKIISSLNLKNQNEEAGYKLIINSNKILETVSRDGAGNASVYKTKITVTVLLINIDKILKEKTFSSGFTYNNLEDKFALNQYQRDIEINLVDKIIEDILDFLII
jgi:hypothetical protein